MLLILILALSLIFKCVSSRPRLGICLLVKDENIDIQEWIEYHRALGIHGIIVMDNNSSQPLLHTLLPYIQEGYIKSYVYYTTPKKHARTNQLAMFNLCLQNHANDFSHIAFIDTDEFINVVDKSKNVIDVLVEYKMYGGLTLNWMVFGSSGQVQRPQGGVLPHYTKCSRNCHVKTIVNTKYALSVGVDNHHFLYKQGYYAVDTNRTVVRSAYNPPKQDSYESCHRTVDSHLYDVMYINHYVVKSQEDFEMKSRRGSPGGKHRRQDFFDDVNRMTVHDCEVLRMPRNLGLDTKPVI